MSYKCDYSACRNMKSNIKEMEKLVVEIRDINQDIGMEISTKISESINKRRICKCASFL